MILESIVEKISHYNLFNYLFPGAIFCLIGQNYLGIPSQNSIVEELLLYYFAGLVISRIGSIIVEPTLRKFKFLVFDEYPNYLKAATTDPKIDTLSTENNMYRSLVTTFASLGFAKIALTIFEMWPAFEQFKSHLAISCLLCLFLLSYRKQTQFIFKRIQATKRDQD